MSMSFSPVRFVQRVALPVALTLIAAAAQAGLPPPLPLGWDEDINGDFSNIASAPTFVSLALVGSPTTILGRTGRSATSGEVDLDYFRIQVPEGYVLETMLVLEGTMSVGSGSFIGLVGGTQFTVPPEAQTAAGLLGWTLFDEGNVGGDLLLFMSAPSFGSTGFSTPLPAGDYSFWVQETGVGSARYAFSMAVTAVPEPATALTLLAGLGLLAAARKRR